MMADFRLPLHSRVRLRDGIDPALYKGFSCTGNEGWVRSRRQEMGYPQVLIEWDRDHWSYNGAPNCWTWESHFDLIEGNMSEKKPKPNEEAVRNLTEGFVKGLFKELGLSSEQIAEVDEETAATGIEAKESDESTTEEALAAIQNAKAFIVVTMQEDKAKSKVIYPAIFQEAENEELALICQAQLAHLVALLQDGLIHQRIQAKQGE